MLGNNPSVFNINNFKIRANLLLVIDELKNSSLNKFFCKMGHFKKMRITMKRALLYLIIAGLFLQLNLIAQSIPPKREFRGAWIATVTNLDWPSANNLTTGQQKAQLISILDSLKALNFNSVIFQVRSECDAMYNSPYEPWSYWLTGKQGRPPSPYYDPLQFAVKEAHKRGLEIQAWFNPYRAVRNVQSAYAPASNHVTVQHPDWIVTYGNVKVLDPGLPQVRDYITKVIMDVVRRYDIDGVHFDDYFYPYPISGLAFNDNATFANYPNGYTAEQKADWRRNNVNQLIQMVYDSIQTVKPYVKFGIAPFGIWKSGVPAGIVGLSAYSDVYADGVYWLQHHIIDYITPELYWPFGGGQDYGKLMPWWASQTNGRHLYVGEAAYRIVNWSSPSEMPNHIRLSRTTANCYGNIFFRTLVGILDNEKGFKDSLRSNFYKYPALLPVMKWKDTVAPQPPGSVRYERIAATGQAGLEWDVPSAASDGDTADRYVVYRFDKSAVSEADLSDPRNIVSVEGEKVSYPGTPPPSVNGYYYVITSLDRNSNESTISQIINVKPPQIPLLASPSNDAINQRDTVVFKWQYPDNASSYRLQLSTDSIFSNGGMIIDQSAIKDTFNVVTGILGQQKYYWRISASNAGGVSSYSQTFDFRTGFPVIPKLTYPEDKTYIHNVNPDFMWHTEPTAESYRIQLAKALDYTITSLIADTIITADTSFMFSRLNINLDTNKIYFWHVSAINQYGTSNWSETFKFIINNVTGIENETQIPKNYTLSQNYPNPFNPTTRIDFELPKAGFTTLSVYDILGRKVEILLSKELSGGRYSVNFNASKLSSGMYIYILQSKGIMIVKKMMLLK
jgi:uncharacterized lipoprotein YddW (UPF0748 family)